MSQFHSPTPLPVGRDYPYRLPMNHQQDILLGIKRLVWSSLGRNCHHDVNITLITYFVSILTGQLIVVVACPNKSQTKAALSLHKLHKKACCFTSWNMTSEATISYEDTIVFGVPHFSIFRHITYWISLIAEGCLPSSPSRWGRLGTHRTEPERSLRSGREWRTSPGRRRSRTSAFCR